MAVRKITVCVPPELYDEFCYYGSRTGVTISGFLQAKMKEFIEEEKIVDELRKNNKLKGHP